MAPRYFHLHPQLALPSLEAKPFRAVIVADLAVDEAWLNRVAEWLVAEGCLYVIAWGIDCEKWHDSVDWANLEAFDFGVVPDNRFVMTTWHSDEPVSEAYWFAEHCAHHPDVELIETLILHVATKPRAEEVIQAYQDSQMLADED